MLEGIEVKNEIIVELLSPVDDILSEISLDKNSKVKLELALNKVRSNLNDLFGDMFDADDPYAFMVGEDDYDDF